MFLQHLLLRAGRLAAPLVLAGALAIPAACAQLAPVQEAPLVREAMMNHNSIQPETTLSITATGEVRREPDTAFITLGVETEAETAAAAMADNRSKMNGVFDALRAAGIAQRDIQTSNFSLSPRYDYVEEEGRRGRQVLRGYAVSNQVTARVRELATLGATMDSLVEAGGNTFNSLRFALDDDTQARNEARRAAMGEAISRAELYAEAAGYRVARIVTISEYESQGGPEPMMMARMASMAESAPTPIAGGEIGYSVQVNVTFELSK